MKKALAAILALLILIGNSSAAYDCSVRVTASQCVLMDTATGRILYQRGDNGRMLIASTTKMMTALVVAEHCTGSETVEIMPEAAAVEGSSMYLRAGEKLTVRELLYGLLLESGNDAAAALACFVSGSIGDFAALMNEKAAELGLVNSHFENPHGLDSENHYSCAYDLAVIAREFMQVRLLADIAGTKMAHIAGRTMRNHNKMLWDYEGAVGIKTGYTEHAGRSLVTCAVRNGVSLICVTLCDADDWAEQTALLNWGFETFCPVSAADTETPFAELEVISGTSDKVSVFPEENVILPLCESDKLEYRARLPQFLYAPVRENAEIGSVDILVNGETVKSVALVSHSEVPADENVPLNFWEKIKRGVSLGVKYGYMPFGIYYFG